MTGTSGSTAAGPRAIMVAGRRSREFVASTVWTAVGVMLIAWAVTWLSALPTSRAAGFAAAGVVGALTAWWFLFRRLALANAARIEAGPESACVFGFQTWKSYLVMVGMIALGVVVRGSSVPRPYLAIVYAAVGGGLLLAAASYHRSLLLRR